MGFDCLPSLFSSERGLFLCVASILISLCGPPCDIATHAHAHSAFLQTGSALWGPDTKTHSATRHQDCPLGANTQSINRDLHSRTQALNSHCKSYKLSSVFGRVDLFSWGTWHWSHRRRHLFFFLKRFRDDRRTTVCRWWWYLICGPIWRQSICNTTNNTHSLQHLCVDIGVADISTHRDHCTWRYSGEVYGNARNR